MALLAFNSCGVGKRLQNTGILADDSGKGGLASKSLSHMGLSRSMSGLGQILGT